MKPEFTIFECENGVMVEYPNPNGEGTVNEVFENQHHGMMQHRLGELETAEKVLYTILEIMGWRYNKHEKINLTIRIEGKEDD